MPVTPPTIQDILDRSRVFLNDKDEDLYTNAVLIPFLKAANDEFRDELLVHGINSQKTVSEYYTVSAGTTTLDPLPDDFINPVQLWQRQSGSDDNFTKIVELVWPDGYTGDSDYIAYWNYRNQEITLTSARLTLEVRLDYNRALVEVGADVDADVEIKGSVNFLAAKTAELAAMDIGQNPVEGSKNAIRASKYLGRLLQINIKNQQGVGARRRPFRRRAGLRIL